MAEQLPVIDIQAERTEETVSAHPIERHDLGLDVTRLGQQWFEGPIMHFEGHHYNLQGEAAFRALVPERYKRG